MAIVDESRHLRELDLKINTLGTKLVGAFESGDNQRFAELRADYHGLVRDIFVKDDFRKVKVYSGYPMFLIESLFDDKYRQELGHKDPVENSQDFLRNWRNN